MTRGAARLGTGDCERIRDGWLAQPFNALTSLAFIVSAGATMRRALRGAGPPRGVGLAAAAAATGVGSFLFHGPQPNGGRRLHDGSMTWLLGQVLVIDTAASTARRQEVTFLAAAGIALGGLPRSRPANVNALVALGASVIAARELHAMRRGVRPLGRDGGACLRAGALAALIPSAAALVLGRTGSPLCDPDRLVQLHGLWHLGAALALDAYARAVAASPTSQGSSLRGPRGGKGC